MLFSIIIPAYNCEKYLPDTVSDIQNSGLWDYEILLIEDGATDRTAEICDELAEKDSRLRCIHQKNAGVSAARNRGIQEAVGEYILFFDADDGVDPDGFREAAQCVSAERPDMLLFGMSFDHYYHGTLYRREELVPPEEGLWNKAQWSEGFRELYLCNALSPVWNKFIRRTVLTENAVRFRQDLIEMEDFLFSVQCLRECDSVYLFPKAIYRYRQAEDGRSTYNRLQRIGSLTEYMAPFIVCTEQFKQDFAQYGIKKDGAESVLESIYVNLFQEQLRFAAPKQIQLAAQDMLFGPFAKVIQKHTPRLFEQLQQGYFHQVWMRNCVSRMRHWLAVRVKYLLRDRRAK